MNAATTNDATTTLADLRSLSALNDSKQHTIEMRETLYPRVLRAAEILRRRDVCDLVVLGDEALVRDVAAREGRLARGGHLDR